LDAYRSRACAIAQARPPLVRKIPAEVAAAFRERGRTRLPVQLVDLSPKGCKVKLTGAVVVGSHAWIMLPTLESWYARVAWTEAGEAGLDFERPLHEAVTRMIVKRASQT
jgi:hypothetical protein